MKPLRSFILTLPNPCREDWNVMAETPHGGRACARCQKVVLDLKGKTDREIRQALSGGSGSICARIEPNRLGVLITPERPTGVPPLAAAMLTGLALTCVDPTPVVAAPQVTLQAPSASPEEPKLVAQAVEEEPDMRLPWIHGVVFGGLEGVRLPDANVIVKGTTIGTETDSEGSYRLDLGPLWEQQGEITLEVSLEGFETVEVSVGRASSEQEVVLLVLETEDTITVGEVIAVEAEAPLYKRFWWWVRGHLS